MVIAPFWIVVVEGVGPIRAISRSWSLARRRYSPVLGAVLLIALSDAVLTVAISGIAFLFSSFSFGWIIEAVALAGSSLITTPFVAGAVTFLYFEHFDVAAPGGR